MNERQISEKESLAIIEEMICRTRRRLDIGAGNQMLLWGYLTLGVAALTTAAIIFLRTPHANWLWFLLPAIGYPICYRMRRRRRNACTPVTYVDQISAGLWRAVGGAAVIGSLLCGGFMAAGHNAWSVMLIFSFVIIGFATVAQGVIIRENSLVAGGMFGLTAGGFVACCAVCGLPLRAAWFLPLYGAAFVAMMIVPGHMLNRKAKKSCPKN